MRTVFFLPLLTALQEGGVREGGGGGGYKYRQIAQNYL